MDLVVYGELAAKRVMDLAPRLFQERLFARPDPDQMRAPYGRVVPRWAEYLERKQHMGEFRGTRFSLRAVREWSEIIPAVETRPSRRSEIEFRVATADEALFFPSVYRDLAGNQLVDYSVVFEGVLRSGDVFRGACDVVESVDCGPTTFIVCEEQIDRCQILFAE